MHAHTGHTSTYSVRRSFVHVVLVPVHQGLLRAFALGLHPSRRLKQCQTTLFIVLFTSQAFIFGPFSHRLFPYWATLYAPHGIPAVVQSLSSSVEKPLLIVWIVRIRSTRSNALPRSFCIPLLPRSLSFFGLFQNWDLILAVSGHYGLLPSGVQNEKTPFVVIVGRANRPQPFLKNFNNYISTCLKAFPIR